MSGDVGKPIPPVLGPAIGEWRPMDPRYARDLLTGVGAPWWIAGGWAIDLFLGRRSRWHKDLDVGILRPATRAVLAALPGWEFFEAQGGTLFHLATGTSPRPEVNSLWGRPRGSPTWELELVLNDSVDDCLVFRRNTRITLPLAEAIRRGTDRIAYLAPEFQLLYKARLPLRGEDQADFVSVAPHLSASAVSWLREALEITDAEHPWFQHAVFTR